MILAIDRKMSILYVMARSPLAPDSDHPPRVTAVLGPTNTGKTHLAIERMLGHQSGMIGLPLRLLAREIYDRVAAQAGVNQVALITGEEKRVPPRPRYFVCTVEAMPLDRPVAFLAVDEIQLASDDERGHVFTNRLLHARGLDETMFLGAETIRPLLRKLVPGISFIKRPRFSTLSHVGTAKLTRLPPRSAVVAFSAADVYSLAEALRRQRGGAAVVMGALSPRTRNAQVALYQAGEVDYLVATDAIGMGLNMDVDHVAFAALRKFDGRGPRDLRPAELAQIAGRAGRHMNDGSFGTTAGVGVIAPEIVEAIEDHRFAALKTINWRNSKLEFKSLTGLIAGLDAPAPSLGLSRAHDADDLLALKTLAGTDEVAALATTPDAIHLLWEVCRIPDYQKIMADAHARLLSRVYLYLMQGDGRLPSDWVARMVTRLDRVDGDIDTLVARISHIRTWTYISHRAGWVEDGGGWQERTRDIEDRLSDALHDRLTQRFVDRRAALLTRRMANDDDLLALVEKDGAVVVEGHFIGRLEGFRFVADSASAPFESKALWNAARRALKGEIAQRADTLGNEGNGVFAINNDLALTWRGAPVARLTAGPTPITLRVEPLSSEFLAGPALDRVRRRLEAWLDHYLQRRIAPLRALTEAALSGAARGLAFQLVEGLGTVGRRGARREIKALTASERTALGKLGVHIGREAVFVPALLKPRARVARILLWAVHTSQRRLPDGPPDDPVSVAVTTDMPRDFYSAIGYRVFEGMALRVDAVERVAARAFRLGEAGSFVPGPDLLTLAGCAGEAMAPVLTALGFHAEAPDVQGLVSFAAPSRNRRKGPGKAKRQVRSRKVQPVVNPDSPFAKLAGLRLNS